MEIGPGREVSVEGITEKVFGKEKIIRMGYGMVEGEREG